MRPFCFQRAKVGVQFPCRLPAILQSDYALAFQLLPDLIGLLAKPK